MDTSDVSHNADPRDNPAVPKPPPREPIRNAMFYAVLAAAGGLTAAVLFDVLEEGQIIAALGTAGSILAAVWLLMERVRAMVNSPATSAEQAAVTKALAEAVSQAKVTGEVPDTAAEVANEVLSGAVKTVVPPALVAAAVAAGLPASWAAAASPVAVQAAIGAVKEATKRAPNQSETNVRVMDGL